MARLRGDFWTGLGVVLLGLLLVFVAVPEGVVSPRSVRIAVLSPAFWPNILAWLLVVLGGVLAIRAARTEAPDPVTAQASSGRAAGLARLAVFAVGVVLVCLFATTLGLVWTAMLAFFGVVLLTGTRHLLAAIAVAVLLPLALYFFFNHVAGVPIPQGVWVRLP